MNLVRRLIARDCFIEGIQKEELRRILAQENREITVRSMKHGNIILSNNKIIKCISKYYLDEHGNQIKSKTASNPCFHYLKQVGIENASYNCLICHLQCLEKLKQNKLIAK